MTSPGSLSLSKSGVSPAKPGTSIASYWMKPPTRPVFNLKPTTRGARFSRVASNRGRLRGLVEGTVCKKLFYIMKYDIWYNIYIYCVFGVIFYRFNDKWSRNQSTNLVSQYPLSCCEIMITSGERRLSGFPNPPNPSQLNI